MANYGWSYWFYSFSGLIFEKEEPLWEIKLLFFIAIHGFYIGCFFLMDDFLDSENTVYSLGFLKSASSYSRFFEVSITILKLCWFFYKSDRIGTILNDCHANRCVIRDSIEICLIQMMLKRTEDAFLTFNNQLMRILEDIGEDSSGEKGNDFFEENSDEASGIANVCYQHFRLVSLMKDLQAIETFNVALRLIINIIEVVNVIYTFVVAFFERKAILLHFSWIIYQFHQDFYIIYMWDSLATKRTENAFLTLNNQLIGILEDIEKYLSGEEGNDFIGDNSDKDLGIANVCYVHFRLVSLIKDFQAIETFNVALRLIINIIEAVNVLYVYFCYSSFREKRNIVTSFLAHLPISSRFLYYLYVGFSCNKVFGLTTFQKADSNKFCLYGATLLFHILYFSCTVLAAFAPRQEAHKRSLMGEVLLVCRLTTGIFIISKIFHIYRTAETFEDLNIEKSIQMKRIGFRLKKLKLVISHTFFLVALINTTGTLLYWRISGKTGTMNEIISWCLSMVRDSAECDYMRIVCRELQNLLNHINERLETVLSRIGNIQEKYPIDDLRKKKSVERPIFIDDLLLSLQYLSEIHWRTTKIVQEFGNILIFNVILQLMKNFLDIVTEAYFTVTIVFYSFNYNFILAFSCFMITVTLTVSLIDSWASCSFHANRTVIILHDIWNKYVEKRGIDRKLLYLQFISMRFLTCKLKFTAYGFFPLDWSFLHTIVASATTYIIILVQLKK
ncbi:uncharacterized protein LOC123307160 [Coccinella septempunctata]|uniref:uncharacterized protein LOC123307160 n=1 Tax=Coccinella septempunctata TaxID=41139 RepID=UPI001D087AED|nr:uncharacterized protein LOC123307160 [Coccinella septempunctata]